MAYVGEFESDLEANLMQLKYELETLSYLPAPLSTFIIRDPKTRKISASDFRDRVVHHALVNVVGPIFESRFIFDSWANRKGKGTHKAVLRCESFMRKVPDGYAFKADIRHYFDTVDQRILMRIIGRKITDPKVLWLINTILCNHAAVAPCKGMPIGNLTSQFFANVYLNELDQYVKHVLKCKYYIRYVDDFVVLHATRQQLEYWRAAISKFVQTELQLGLHPDKSRIVRVSSGITFLGFRLSLTHRLLKKSNQTRIFTRIQKFADMGLSLQEVLLRIEGWFAYASFARTYKLCKSLRLAVDQIFLVEQ
jgi:retron-type reverse transcriptase